MIIQSGMTTVSTSGTEQRLSNTPNRVLWLKLKAPTGNSGTMLVGDSSVTPTSGYELSAGNSLEIDLRTTAGSLIFNTVYVDTTTNGDKLSWIVILDG